MEPCILLVAYWDGAKVCGNSSGIIYDDEHLTEAVNRAEAYLAKWKINATKIVTFQELQESKGSELINSLKQQVSTNAERLMEIEINNMSLPEDEIGDRNVDG